MVGLVGSWYSTLNDDKNLSQVGVDINVDVCAERERESDDPEVWFIKTCPQTRGPSSVVSLTPRCRETRED